MKKAHAAVQEYAIFLLDSNLRARVAEVGGGFDLTSEPADVGSRAVWRAPFRTDGSDRPGCPRWWRFVTLD